MPYEYVIQLNFLLNSVAWLIKDVKKTTLNNQFQYFGHWTYHDNIYI